MSVGTVRTSWLVAAIEAVAEQLGVAELAGVIITRPGGVWHLCALVADFDDALVLGGGLGLDRVNAPDSAPLYGGRVDIGHGVVAALLVGQSDPDVAIALDT